MNDSRLLGVLGVTGLVVLYLLLTRGDVFDGIVAKERRKRAAKKLL